VAKINVGLMNESAKGGLVEISEFPGVRHPWANFNCWKGDRRTRSRFNTELSGESNGLDDTIVTVADLIGTAFCNAIDLRKGDFGKGTASWILARHSGVHVAKNELGVIATDALAVRVDKIDGVI